MEAVVSSFKAMRLVTATPRGPGSNAAPAARLTALEALQLHLPLPACAVAAAQARCPLMLEVIPADFANAFHGTTLVNLAKVDGEASAGSEADQAVAIHDLYPLQSTVRSFL